MLTGAPQDRQVAPRGARRAGGSPDAPDHGGDEARACPRQSWIALGVAAFFLALGNPLGGVVGIQVQYTLKDSLLASPLAIARFNGLVGIPFYLSVVFGALCDALPDWHRRCLFVASTVAGSALYLVLAWSAPSLGMLLWACASISLAFAIMNAVGLAGVAAAGQEEHRPGIASGLWNAAGTLPGVFAFAMGGWVQRTGTPGFGFALAAVVTLGTAACLYRPRGTPREYSGTPGARRAGFRAYSALVSRTYLALIGIVACFEFSPGWQTPLFFRLTGDAGLSSSGYGSFLAILTASQVPGIVLFALLSLRFNLRRLLWAATAGMLVQSPLPLLMTGPWSADLLAVPAGATYGFAGAAFFGLFVQSCPLALRATVMTSAISVGWLAQKMGDLAGSLVFQHLGFTAAIVSGMLTTPLIALLVSSLAVVPAASVVPGSARPGL